MHLYLIFFKLLSRRRLIQGLILALLMVISGLLEIFSIGAIIPLVSVFLEPSVVFTKMQNTDFVKSFEITEKNIKTIILIGFVFVVLLAGAMRTFVFYLQSRYSHRLGNDVGFKLLNTFLTLSVMKNTNQSIGDQIAIMSAKNNLVVYQSIMPILVLSNALILLLMMTVVSFLTSPAITIGVIICLSVLYTIVYLVVKPMLNNISKDISPLNSKYLSIAENILSSKKEILFGGFKGKLTKKFQKIDFDLKTTMSDMQIISAVPRYILEALILTVLALFFYFSLDNKEFILSELPLIAAGVIFLQKVIPVAQLIYAQLSYLRSGKSALVEITEVLKAEENNSPAIELKFENVELRSVVARPRTNEINIKIEAGDFLLVSGKSGIGKSTLTNATMGIGELVNGKILIDGKNIGEICDEEIIENVSYVSQNPSIFECSFWENITCNQHTVKQDSINATQIIDELGLSDLYHRTRKKAAISASEISGGQRQRVAIARALYKQAKLTILDEPTSALDDSSAKMVIKSLKKRLTNSIVIIVSHDQRIQEICNKKLLLSEDN